MIVWHVPRMETPACLTGCRIARVHCELGDQLALAQYAEMLPVSADFVRLKPGVSAAKVGGFDPEEYAREIPWAVALNVRDGYGATWRVPALLSPEGAPICDRSWILTEAGEWTRGAISEIQDRALLAAQAAHPLINSPTDIEPTDLLRWAMAIIESAYHLDTLTIGRLGLLTTTSAMAIVRGASGWVPDAHR
jgi:hypothetical protein